MSPKKTNPKTHDQLFKWLLTAMTGQFFDFFYPDINVRGCEVIDKEFLAKFPGLKESLKGDLFLLLQVEIDERAWEIVILIEHKSERRDVRDESHHPRAPFGRRRGSIDQRPAGRHRGER